MKLLTDSRRGQKFLPLLTSDNTSATGSWAIPEDNGEVEREWPTAGAMLAEAGSKRPAQKANSELLSRVRGALHGRAAALLADPGIELLSRVYAAMAEIEHAMPPRAQRPRRKVRRGRDDGDELDLEEAARGRAAWSRVEREGRKAGRPKVVRVAISTVTGADDAENGSLASRGAAAAALADVLERRGIRVELTAIWCGREAVADGRPYVVKRGGIQRNFQPVKAGAEWTGRVTLKRAEDPVDLAGLAATMASPDFFRAAGQELLVADAETKLGPSVGWVAAIPAAEAEKYDLVLDQGESSTDAVLAALSKLDLDREEE